MAFDPAATSSLLAVGVMLLLAGWLLWLDFESRVNRAFALFLFLRAGLALFNTLFILSPEAIVLWRGIRGYFAISATLALVYFGLTYFGPSRGWIRIARGTCLGLAAVSTALYAVDHCLEVCIADDGTRFGPLALVSYALPLAYATMGLLLVQRAVRAVTSMQRRAAAIVAVAFLANSLLDGVLAIPGWFDVVVQGRPSIYAASFFVPAALTLYVLAVPAALAAVAVLLKSVAGQSDAARYRSRSAAISVLAILSGAFVGWNPTLPGDFANAKYFVIGAWRLLLPSLVAYALVRHRLFDLDVKIRIGVRVGGMAGVFVSVFFVATEMAQNFLGEVTQSPLIGIVFAGSLAFFFHPLQRTLDRLSERAVPGAKPLDAMSHPERVQLFLDQATVAWSDGTMTRRERIMLSQLQSRLGLSIEEAAMAEAQAFLPGGRQRGRAAPARG